MANGKIDLTREEKMRLPWEGFNQKKRSDETGIEIKEKSLTQLGMQEQTDINWIVDNFMPTAIPQNVRQPMYGDFTGISDYQTAIHAIREAEASFMQMPAELRARLDNDPQKFLEYCDNPANLEEMRKYGLAVKKPDPEPEPKVKEKDPSKTPATTG